MHDDNQPATKKDMETFAQQIVSQLRDEMKQQGTGIVTQLREEMQTQGNEIVTQLRKEMKQQGTETISQLRVEMQAQGSGMVTQFREELDKKLLANRIALTKELKDHTEEVVGRHAGEVLQAIADVIEPLQANAHTHGHRITKLKHQPA